MESKKAIAVLTMLIENHSLSVEEKEAVLVAIGVLDCATLAENRLKSIIKSKKTKRDKSLEL